MLGLAPLLGIATALPAVAQQVIADTASATDSAPNRIVVSQSEVASTTQGEGSTSVTNCPANIQEQLTGSKRRGTEYVPLSAHCKFRLFVRQTYSPYTFASTAWGAGWAQATDGWPQYGPGMAGFGKRFGAALSDTESRRFIQGFALSAVLHQDPRYFQSQKKGLLARAWYAATRVAISRNDDGRGTFNSPELMGALLTSSLQNAYYPKDDRSFGQTIGRFGGALSSDVTGNLLREFTPDIKRFLKKHTPKKVENFERGLPTPKQDKF